MRSVGRLLLLLFLLLSLSLSLSLTLSLSLSLLEYVASANISGPLAQQIKSGVHEPPDETEIHRLSAHSGQNYPDG